MRPLSETLIELISFAENTVCRPLQGTGGVLATLAQEVRRADALPAEGIRTTRAAMIMIITIEEFFATERVSTSQWLMLAGATLPLLRAEAWVATRNEKEARAGS